jgi:hypothetical protein
VETEQLMQFNGYTASFVQVLLSTFTNNLLWELKWRAWHANARYECFVNLIQSSSTNHPEELSLFWNMNIILCTYKQLYN